ncbi:MAG: LLM class flavin-dependent oxidoreductase [Myxococcales bacterium]|nr:LLM class flavin-dependent oxidoreductase [Myxococcales bacterium]
MPRLRFGIFMAPFHPVRENPTLSLRRDLELIDWLDELGFDEAWIGEHHSAGYEIIASPEVFIAAAAERTRRIRLGTGVSSLPYHHPLMLAERINQLDHMTRGRVMFGVGPGALPSDAFMMGIDPLRQRDMMEEAIEVLLRLFRGETVTHKSDWFEMHNARLHLTPYSDPHVEIAVASQISPAGARAAGSHGLSLLSIGATSTGGFNAMATNWEICEAKAAEHAQQVDRNGWRLVGPMHIAETREQARQDVRFGLENWIYYFREIAALPLAPEGAIDDAVDAMTKSGFAVIGNVDDAIEQIERLEKQSGGFGCYMNLAHEWADRDATHKSYELMARYVMPHFQERSGAHTSSLEWARSNREQFMGAHMQAVGNQIQKHVQEQAAKADGEETG